MTKLAKAVWLLIGAGIVLAGCGGDAPETQQEGAFTPAVEVALPVQRELIEYDIFTGRFVAVKDVAISPRVSGFVQSVDFEEGTIVETGQPLFRLDRDRFQADVARLEASLSQARTAATLARSELERAEGLLARRAVSEQEVDRLRADLANNEAVITGVEADISRARIDLRDTVIRAPFSGRMSDTRVDVGALVTGGSANATVLATLVSVDPVEIVFDGAESDFLRYSRLDIAGNSASSRTEPAAVDVRLADEVEWSHAGQINFVDNRLDDASGTIRVRATVANPDDILVSGLFGEVRVPVRGPYAALLVPDEAIVTDQTRKTVLVVAADNTVVQKPVELGGMDGGLRIVRSGLEPGDRVIVGGLMMARPGGEVNPSDVTRNLITESSTEAGQ